MRRLLVVSVLLIAAYFLVTHNGELGLVVETLQRGDFRWLALAIAVQLAWVVNVAAIFRAIYRLLGVEEKLERLAAIAAAFFVNIVAPSMGMGGLTLFVVDGKRRRVPTGRVTTAVALYYLYEYFGFLVVLLLGLLVLLRRNQLGSLEILASLAFLATGSVIGGLVLLGLRSSEKLGLVLEKSGRAINGILYSFLHRDYLNVSRAREFAGEISDGLTYLRRSPGGLPPPLGLSLFGKAIQITILFLVFLAFQQPFSVGTLVAGFSIGYLLLIVSPTPAGIGFVEGAMTLGLNTLHVPLAAAAVITIAYRGITFWLPFGYGMLSSQWLAKVARPLPRMAHQRPVSS